MMLRILCQFHHTPFLPYIEYAFLVVRLHSHNSNLNGVERQLQYFHEFPFECHQFLKVNCNIASFAIFSIFMVKFLLNLPLSFYVAILNGLLTIISILSNLLMQELICIFTPSFLLLGNSGILICSYFVFPLFIKLKILEERTKSTTPEIFFNEFFNEW